METLFESVQDTSNLKGNQKSRQESINRYYTNPKYCLKCGNLIRIKKGGKAVHARKKKFCDHSCAAAYNNKGVCRNGMGRKQVLCDVCKHTIQTIYSKNTKYCSSECRVKSYKLARISKVESGVSVSSKVLKKYLIDKYGNVCSQCGWCAVNPSTGNVPIELHHIDGCYRNNTLANVLLLCPNCHSLTKNFRFLNKGKGRWTALGYGKIK